MSSSGSKMSLKGSKATNKRICTSCCPTTGRNLGQSLTNNTSRLIIQAYPDGFVGRIHLFQSLLWWIRRWKYEAVELYDNTLTGFNPYCGGSDAGSIPVCIAILLTYLFQSLLWWIRRWKVVTRSPLGSAMLVSILIVVDQTLEVQLREA